MSDKMSSLPPGVYQAMIDGVDVGEASNITMHISVNVDGLNDGFKRATTAIEAFGAIASRCEHDEDSRVPLEFDGSPADPDEWACIDCGHVEQKRMNGIAEGSLEFTVPFASDYFNFEFADNAGVRYPISTQRRDRVQKDLEHYGQGMLATFEARVDPTRSSWFVLTAIAPDDADAQALIDAAHVLSTAAGVSGVKTHEFVMHPAMLYRIRRHPSSTPAVSYNQIAQATMLIGEPVSTDVRLPENEIWLR